MNWTILTMALIGIASLVMRGRSKPGLRPFIFGWLVCTFLCVCPGFYFRSHYFIVMLPVVAMLAGVGGCELWRLADRWKWAATASPNTESPTRHKRHHPKPEKGAENSVLGFGPFAVPVALVVLAALAWPVWTLRGFFFAWPPQVACRVIYSANPFNECPEIAKYLKEHTVVDETIAVLGSEPEVFFDAQRNSATGYIYTYGLMESQPLADWMQEKMIAEIEASKPRFIILVDVYFSWLYSGNSKFLLQEWANRYLRENYDLVGVVERPATGNPLYRWDESGASPTPQFVPPVPQWMKIPPQLPGIRNDKGENFKLGLVGSLAGYQLNVAGSECVLWICRRK
jgi:hypothetical protein